MQAVIDALAQHGIEAVESEEDGVVRVEVPCGDDASRDCAELMAQIETWLSESGLPFVPEERGDRIYVRPPAA